ncbi:hypothetical protein [Ferruginibacter sp.]
MKRLASSVCIVILLTCTPRQTIAQPDFSDDLYYSNNVTYEIGGSIGVMNCLTDLGGRKGIGKKFIKDINLGKTQPAGSVFVSAVYKNALVLRSEATWGVVTATDAILKNVKETTFGRYERNLSFRSTIFEVALITEIHPRFFRKYADDEKLPRFSPYALGGIGYFRFNPQAKLDSEWIDLQRLATEGQGFVEYPHKKIYKLKQINFPVGAGFKYKLSPLFNFSAEFVYRILNTDYLDDVSTTYIDPITFSNPLNNYSVIDLARVLKLYDRQSEINPSHITNVGDTRGNPKNKDAYFSINLKVGFIF